MLKSGRNWRRRQKQSIDDSPETRAGHQGPLDQSAIGATRIRVRRKPARCDAQNSRAREHHNYWRPGGRLSCRTEAPDESRHPDLIASDFPKSILSLRALGKLVCSITQIGEQRDDLLHLSYVGSFNSDLVQRHFLPNWVITKSIALAAPAAMSRSACI